MGIVQVRLPSGRQLTLQADDQDYIAWRLMWHGLDGYEPETLRVVSAFAATSKVVLDIGANVGLISLVAALHSSGPEVFAFEPHPDTLKRLRMNVAANPCANIHVMPLAVGCASGKARLTWDAADATAAMATVLRVHPDRAQEMPLRASVEVTTIDEWCSTRGISGVGLVKIDVEGAEPEVLLGMQQVAAKQRPAVIVEVLGDRSAEAVTWFCEKFDCHHSVITSRGCLPTHYVFADSINLNHLLVPSEAELPILLSADQRDRSVFEIHRTHK